MNRECTLEIFKLDGRCKSGSKLVKKVDLVGDADLINGEMLKYEQQNLIVKLYDTYVTSRNVLTGEEFKERYDVPYYCSPRSETYWCS